MEGSLWKLIMDQTIAAWKTHLGSVIMTAMVPTVHREESLTRLRNAIITATMTTRHQKRLENTHSSDVAIPHVFQSISCAEATPCARTGLTSELVMTLSGVPGVEEWETDMIQRRVR